MNPDMERFLNLKDTPARLTAEQASWLLGFSPHEIPILMAKGLLKPLGHPAHNGQKFFLAATLQDLRRDEKWFTKASDAVSDYWRYKNSRKSQNAPDDRRQSQSTGAPQLAGREN
ncbi:MAG TPA: hypothetical protein VN281_03245 [Verrucomicrobiae bacterium]|jgi:hypothetical protein|nr:hypothetical protein [Verrucomicrobiae bacterium]